MAAFFGAVDHRLQLDLDRVEPLLEPGRVRLRGGELPLKDHDLLLLGARRALRDRGRGEEQGCRCDCDVPVRETHSIPR